MVILVGSTYYMYYTVSSFGSQTSVIGYATSTTMEVGSWTDHGSTGIKSDSTKVYNALDPSVYLAADGSYYMTFGSFWGSLFFLWDSLGVGPTATRLSISFSFFSFLEFWFLALFYSCSCYLNQPTLRSNY